MNPSLSRPDSAIDEQAAHWAARLDGDFLEAGERAALDAWLAKAPAHRAALSAYCQLSADLEERLPKLVASGAISLPAPSARRRWTFPRLATVTLAAAAVLALTVWLGRPVPTHESFASAVAQRTAVTLSDGTRVELNANTSLRFDNRAAERHVQLAGGEAMFAVTKDPRRPFIVETPAGSVRVTGTKFNVRAEPATHAFEVTVVEGSVQVRPTITGTSGANEAPVPLGAGDQLVAGVEGVSVRALTAGALQDALAWQRGLAVFNNVPLRDAAARFSRYHGHRIIVDPAVAQTGLGGQYSLDDLNGFLGGIESALAIDIKFDRDGAVYLNPRRNP